MSVEITQAMVNQYSSNVFHLSQQKGSRLRNAVRVESQKSEAAFYDRIGSVEPQKKLGRHSETTYSDTPHSRRKVALEDYFYSDLVDKEDKIRIIQSPESEYAKAAMMSLGRAMDDEIILAALGNAYAGKSGSSAVAHPNSQKLIAHDGTSTGAVGLNEKTLRSVKRKFNENEAGDSDIYFSVTAKQLDSLLSEERIVSSDFAAVKALVNGDIDSFMGFKFIRTERLSVTSASTVGDKSDGAIGGAADQTVPAGADRCFAWQKEGLLLAIGQDMKSSIDVLPTKHFSTQVYCSMGIGSTRLEEEKVVEIICN